MRETQPNRVCSHTLLIKQTFVKGKESLMVHPLKLRLQSQLATPPETLSKVRMSGQKVGKTLATQSFQFKGLPHAL